MFQKIVKKKKKAVLQIPQGKYKLSSIVSVIF